MLSKYKAERFHTINEIGLFLFKMTRPAIQHTISILCSRADDTNEGDSNKYRRAIF